MKTDFLPLYTGMMMLILIGTIFIADKQTPKSLFLLLITMFLSLILYFWRQNKSSSNITKIPSIEDFQKSSKRPKALVVFETQAQSIFQQIKMQTNSNDHEMHYYSRSSGHGPKSISELKSSVQQFSEQTNILGTYNVQTWREQFRQVLQYFKNNMNSKSSDRENYFYFLPKLGVNIDCVFKAEDAIETFLKDKVTAYCANALNIVNEINKIMNRNFGLSISKMPSTNSKQISLSELKDVIFFYEQNRTLPSKYKNMAISISPSKSFAIQEISLSLGRQPACKLDTDMFQLMKYWKILAPMNWNSLQIICPYLLIYILQLEFPSLKIIVKTKQKANSSMRQNANIFNSAFNSASQTSIHFLLIQMDQWLCWESLPSFRNKNLKKITLLFLIMLIQRDSAIDPTLRRSIYRFLK